MELFILIIFIIIIVLAIIAVFSFGNKQADSNIGKKSYEELSEEIVELGFGTLTTQSVTDEQFDSLVIGLSENIQMLPTDLKQKTIDKIHQRVTDFYQSKISPDSNLYRSFTGLLNQPASLNDLLDFVCDYRISEYSFVTVSFDVKGINHRSEEEQKASRNIVCGEYLKRVKEPTNEYDPHAIKVMYHDFHIGYVEKLCSQQIGYLMNHPYECTVNEIEISNNNYLKAQVIFDPKEVI